MEEDPARRWGDGGEPSAKRARVGSGQGTGLPAAISSEKLAEGGESEESTTCGGRSSGAPEGPATAPPRDEDDDEDDDDAPIVPARAVALARRRSAASSSGGEGGGRRRGDPAMTSGAGKSDGGTAAPTDPAAAAAVSAKHSKLDSRAAAAAAVVAGAAAAAADAALKTEFPSPEAKVKKRPPAAGSGGGGGGARVAGGAGGAVGEIQSEARFEPLNCWWEKDEKELDPSQRSGQQQWTYLEHHGLLFTKPYEKHGVPVHYGGEAFVLPAPAEEVANYWCLAADSDYGKKSRFVDNFFTAFQHKLPEEHPLREARFEEVDFSAIKAHLDAEREALREQRKAMTKEDKARAKLQKDREEGAYQYALFDWLRELVGTYKTEPPSLFRGRGEHPKMGRLKRRIFPEEVTLNCHRDAPVPRLEGLPGHSWRDVLHDHQVSWLAYYHDTVNGQFKYTFLGAGSAVKGQKDYAKYEKARKLKNFIDKIRADYTGKLTPPAKGGSANLYTLQLGTATYMLDVLALRVGNEKDSSEEADTVGCCSLRVEHISFDHEKTEITLDFLGKDSIRYLNIVKVDPQVFKNLILFCKGKKPADMIFDKVQPAALNKYLKDFMPGLSAKVFRTFNASVTLQRELDKLDAGEGIVGNPEALKQFYDSANRAVAILCNHQRSVPKQHETSMDRMKVQLHRIQLDIAEISQYINFIGRGVGRGNSTRTFKFEPPDELEEGVKLDPALLERAAVVKTGMTEAAARRKQLLLEKRKETHNLRMQMKDDNKTVSNTTSKQHYMDPRITVAFCKKWELPIEKLFNVSLRKKFPWAMYAKSDYAF